MDRWKEGRMDERMGRRKERWKDREMERRGYTCTAGGTLGSTFPERLRGLSLPRAPSALTAPPSLLPPSQSQPLTCPRLHSDYALSSLPYPVPALPTSREAEKSILMSRQQPALTPLLPCLCSL